MVPTPERDERLTQVEEALARITERVRVLEGGAVPAPEPVPARAAADAETTGRAVDVTSAVGLLGRTILILGGAYFLRALTDSGRIPIAAGVIAGLAYALVWLIAADRAPTTKRTSAAFHGATAMLLALPIVWESATRFDLFSAPLAALLLAGLAALALIVAGRRDLPSVAGAGAFGTIVVALATGWATDHYGAYAVVLVALSTATFWYSERPRHSWLRWPVAIVAGLAVMIVTARAASTPARESLYLARALQDLLIVTVQSSLAIRLVLLSRNARLFDVMLGFSAFAISIGGAVIIADGSTSRIAFIGVYAAILGSGAYLAAFFRLADRPHLATSYHAFAAFGLAAGTTAITLLFHDHALAIVALALALATLALGQRRLGGYATVHAAVFLIVSLLASDLLATAFSVWVSRPDPWPSMDLVAWITLAAAGACAVMPAAVRTGLGGALTTAGRVVMAAVFLTGAGGAALMVLAPVVAHDAGALASLRTVLLSLAAMGLALAPRGRSTSVFGMLVYPVLVICGIRMVVDDLRHSRPSTLFVALALYGLALVIAGRARKAAFRSARADD